MILGIDASTTCVGWCMMYDDGTLDDIGYLELEGNLYEKLDKVRNLVTKLHARETPGGLTAYIEAPLARSNNQNVVNLLQRWNGMVCTALNDRLRKPPILVEQRTALKHLGIRIPKGVKGRERKKYILQCVKNFGTIAESKWENKRTGNPREWCYDQADAYVIASAGLKMNEQGKGN